MASAYIREYSDIPHKGSQNVPVTDEPPHVTQTVTFTSATDSNPFHAKTTYIGIYTDAAAYVEFGESPTAVATSIPLEANKVYHFGVNKGHVVSVYDGTS